MTDVQLGVIAVMLARGFQRWVQRRVEHIAYLDAVTLRHSESVMVRWPPPGYFPDAARPCEGDTVYVPLDLLSKGSLGGLDAINPDGTPVPMVTSARGMELAAAGLTVLAYALVHRHPGPDLSEHEVEVIDAVVRSPADLAVMLASHLDDTRGHYAGALVLDRRLLWLAQQLARNELFVVPAVYEPHSEVVYRYSYCQALPWTHPTAGAREWLKAIGHRTLASFGLTATPANINGLLIGLASSYHLEVEVPGGVKLSRARLYGRYWLTSGSGARGSQEVVKLVAEGGDSPLIDLAARRPTVDVLHLEGKKSGFPTQPPHYWPPPKGADVPQILASAADSLASAVDATDTGYATLRFRPDPFGTLLAVTAVSVLTALLLIAAQSRLRELDEATAAAVLLAFPVVALGYLASPGEHSFATRLLRAPRFAALAVGMCALVVAGLLAAGFIQVGAPPSRAVPRGIKLATSIATVFAVILAVAMAAGWLSTWLRSPGRMKRGPLLPGALPAQPAPAARAPAQPAPAPEAEAPGKAPGGPGQAMRGGLFGPLLSDDFDDAERAGALSVGNPHTVTVTVDAEDAHGLAELVTPTVMTDSAALLKQARKARSES